MPAKPKGPHWHLCPRCGGSYEDSCKDLGRTECVSCRIGRERPLWLRDREPIDCCTREGRPAAREDKDRYRLIGDGWFICRHCQRTYGLKGRM